MFIISLLLIIISCCPVAAFSSGCLQQRQQQQQQRTFSQTTSRRLGVVSRNMVPRFDPMTRRWEPTTLEDSEGYGIVGSLIRQGPLPFVQRLFNSDDYEQGVLKMMANSDERMSRNEAQGNFDAYLQNPNDWAVQKMEEKNGAPKFDYANANMEPSELVLTGLWSLVLLSFVGRIVYVLINGCDAMCQEYHF
jgi:hypothetical protein